MPRSQVSKSLSGSGPASEAAWTRNRPAVFSAAIAILGAAVFSPALENGFTSWDDNVYVTENRKIADLSLRGIGEVFTSFDNCNYHPLTTLSYRIEHALVGLRPKLYHFDNVLLHSLAAVFAFHLARRWLRSDGGALLAALLFLLHPLRAESVAWVSQRKDVLCAFFYLAALLAYPPPGAASGRGRYVLSLGLSLLALLSKVMAISLPVALAIALAFERRAAKRELRKLIPFAVLAAAFAAINFAAQAAEEAVVGLRGRGLGEHLLSIPVAISFYAGKLLFPIVLSPRYAPPPPAGLSDPRVLAGLALVAAAFAAAWRSFRRRREAFLGLAFFAATWAPVSGAIASSTLVADRYVYLPSFGLSVALAAWIARGLGRRAPRRSVTPARVALGVTVFLLLAHLVLTPLRVSKWKDTYTLWRDALAENPRNAIAHNQLSTELIGDRRYGEAAAEAIACIRAGLDGPPFLYNLALAYRGLGAYEKELETAREIVRKDPKFLPAWLVILRHETRSGRLEEAEKLLAEIERRFSPDRSTVLFARSEIARARGDLRRALAYALRSLEVDPADPEVIIASAALVARLGDPRRAVATVRGAFDVERWILDAAMREELAELIDALESCGRPELLEDILWLRKIAD